MMSIFLNLVVAAMQHFILLKCLDIIKVVNLIQVRGKTIIVMPIKLVEYGVQKWILWKLTLMPSLRLLINVIHHKENTIQVATEVGVENISGPMTKWHMVQVLITKLTLITNLMLEQNSIQKMEFFPKLEPFLHKTSKFTNILSTTMIVHQGILLQYLKILKMEWSSI